MKRNLALAGVILGWGLIVISGFMLIWDFVMLSMLLTGRVVESAVVAAGFLLKRFAGRYTVGKSA